MLHNAKNGTIQIDDTEMDYISRNTVKKHVDSLVEKRLIYTEPTPVTLKEGTKRKFQP